MRAQSGGAFALGGWVPREGEEVLFGVQEGHRAGEQELRFLESGLRGAAVLVAGRA